MSGTNACTCACSQRMASGSLQADTCAVIVAGGSGERFGDPRGKQFVELAGLPLVSWSILAFDHAPSVGCVVVVCPQARADQMRNEVLARLELQHEVILAPGGATRQDSVFNGLMAAPEEYALVAIHDGARPLVEVDAIERCLAAVRQNKEVDGAICAAREIDTLKVVDTSGRIVATPDRSQYWCAQTPQSFRREAIVLAHENALLSGFEGTDDASLVERAGGMVCVVESPRDNLKVTVPEDLAIVEATLRARMGIT